MDGRLKIENFTECLSGLDQELSTQESFGPIHAKSLESKGNSARPRHQHRAERGQGVRPLRGESGSRGPSISTPAPAGAGRRVGAAGGRQRHTPETTSVRRATELAGLGTRRPREPIQNSDGTFSVPLTHGLCAIVDAEDISLVEKYRWYARAGRKTNYACTWVRRGNGVVSKPPMHRVILNEPDGLEVDHVNGNGLDNRRSNLRICTHDQNTRNRRSKKSGTSSRFIGVRWNKQSRKWIAAYETGGRERYLGSFDKEEDAARVRDKAVAREWGEFARLNFPLSVPGSAEGPLTATGGVDAQQVETST
jgi:hypothetical protein